MKKGSLFSKPL